LQTLPSEIQDSFDVFAGQSVLELRDFVDGQAIFQIFKDRGGGYTRSAEHPSTADFSTQPLCRGAF